MAKSGKEKSGHSQIIDQRESDRYPGPKYIIPSREEVETNFEYAEELYHKILETLTSVQN